MIILDRYVIRRFLANFVILFMLVYALATTIDVILQLDEFTKAARRAAGHDAGFLASAAAFARLIVDFHGPRLFLLYAYLLGVTSVGAMAFTLAQMLRQRELVAILASGASLARVAIAIVAAAVVLNAFQLINSNVIVPHFAPRLIRGHSDMSIGALRAFSIPFTRDANGALLQSAAFHSETQTLERPTILVLDEAGRTERHIHAESAQWDESMGAWKLENGIALIRVGRRGASDAELFQREPVSFFATDLSPRVLTIRRYKLFAQMLSPAQIRELTETTSAVNPHALARIRYGRYSIVLTNLLMLVMALPFFLVRLPQPLLRRSVMCAGVALGALLGATAGREVEIATLSPAAGVFFPVLVMFPLALAAVTFIRT